MTANPNFATPSADVAHRLEIESLPVHPSQTVGIALPTLGMRPIHGLRHLPVGDTSGWYFWAGKTLSSDPEFFSPMHISHIGDRLPEVVPYLSLPPGYRFLIDSGYEDVWFDESILVE